MKKAKVLGLELGTYKDFDFSVDFDQFSDFKPLEGVPIPACDCLAIFQESGAWQAYDEEGEIIAKGFFSATFQ